MTLIVNFLWKSLGEKYRTRSLDGPQLISLKSKYRKYIHVMKVFETSFSVVLKRMPVSQTGLVIRNIIKVFLKLVL